MEGSSKCVQILFRGLGGQGFPPTLEVIRGWHPAASTETPSLPGPGRAESARLKLRRTPPASRARHQRQVVVEGAERETEVGVRAAVRMTFTHIQIDMHHAHLPCSANVLHEAWIEEPLV